MSGFTNEIILSTANDSKTDCNSLNAIFISALESYFSINAKEIQVKKHDRGDVQKADVYFFKIVNGTEQLYSFSVKSGAAKGREMQHYSVIDNSSHASLLFLDDLFFNAFIRELKENKVSGTIAWIVDPNNDVLNGEQIEEPYKSVAI